MTTAPGPQDMIKFTAHLDEHGILVLDNRPNPEQQAELPYPAHTEADPVSLTTVDSLLRAAGWTRLGDWALYVLTGAGCVQLVAEVER